MLNGKVSLIFAFFEFSNNHSGKIAGFNTKSIKPDEGFSYLPISTAVYKQVIQEENENNSQIEESKSKGLKSMLSQQINSIFS